MFDEITYSSENARRFSLDGMVEWLPKSLIRTVVNELIGLVETYRCDLRDLVTDAGGRS